MWHTSLTIYYFPFLNCILSRHHPRNLVTQKHRLALTPPWQTAMFKNRDCEPSPNRNSNTADTAAQSTASRDGTQKTWPMKECRNGIRRRSAIRRRRRLDTFIWGHLQSEGERHCSSAAARQETVWEETNSSKRQTPERRTKDRGHRKYSVSVSV